MSETPPEIDKDISLIPQPSKPAKDPDIVNVTASGMIPNDLVPIALIIDNEVVEIMYVQTRTAAILLSEPKTVDLTDYKKPNGDLTVKTGMIYNESNGKFK
jgi:hypothetical protein